MVSAGYEKLRACLLDLTQPVAQRTHVSFLLRTKATQEAVDILCDALRNKADSPLMRHEIAYILGQIQNASACSLLEEVLRDREDDVLVRHESAEALGAIGRPEALPVLEEFTQDPAPEVAETCRIAVALLRWKKEGEGAPSSSTFHSVDPAPPLPRALPVASLSALLLDPSLSLFERYRAMFSLRNHNNDEAALALLGGLADPSPLFRHEVAYILGQMRREVTAPGLLRVLRDEGEHRMVRHEAAEALGAIGGEEVERALAAFLQDSEQVVQESCHVALDIIDYWKEGDERE